MANLSRLGDKTIILGVLDLANPDVDSVDTVEERIRAALQVVPANRLQLAPDCGMKYLARPIALGKLRALVEAARRVRLSLG